MSCQLYGVVCATVVTVCCKPSTLINGPTYRAIRHYAWARAIVQLCDRSKLLATDGKEILQAAAVCACGVGDRRRRCWIIGKNLHEAIHIITVSSLERLTHLRHNTAVNNDVVAAAVEVCPRKFPSIVKNGFADKKISMIHEMHHNLSIVAGRSLFP